MTPCQVAKKLDKKRVPRQHIFAVSGKSNFLSVISIS